MIHPSAIVDPSARIADDAVIGPFSFVGADVEIGAGSIVESHVVIKGPTRIGKQNHIFQFCSIGEQCQDKKYAGEPTRLEIGDHNVFRESVTVHRGTVQDQSLTRIGSHNLFMAYAHVAHDCVLGDHNIMANVATLAGHVHIGDHVVLGGLSAVHQFCRLGSHAFCAGGSIILRDVPPCVMVGGTEHKPHGINSEGLRRIGLDKDVIALIKRAYKVIYRSGMRAEEAVAELNDMGGDVPQVKMIADFIANSARGIVR